MGDLQSDIHEAKELASSLEHTLHEKLQSGKATIRRASKDLTSSVVHAIGDVVGVVTGDKGKSVRRGSHYSHTDDDSAHHHHIHSRYCRHGRHGEEEQVGLCGKVCNMIRHRFANCALCVSNKWQMLHDLGSNSLGFVWITLLLELAVFLSSAFAQNSQVFCPPYVLHLFRQLPHPCSVNIRCTRGYVTNAPIPLFVQLTVWRRMVLLFEPVNQLAQFLEALFRILRSPVRHPYPPFATF